MFDFSEQVTVRVWKNVKKAGIIPTGHFGHAAITIKGPSVLGGKVHISWWPEEAGKSDAFKQQEGIAMPNKNLDAASELSPHVQEGLRDKSMKPRPNQYSFHFQGETLWGVRPDVKVHLPGLGASGCYWGLSLPRMARWWKLWSAMNSYQLASRTNSCAGAAAQALQMGGGDACASHPTTILYMEPNQVANWAAAIWDELVRLNGGTAQVEAEYNRAITTGGFGRGVTGFGTAADLWDIHSWKKASAVALAVRSTTIRSIDSHLESYHKLDWSGNFGPKLAAMAGIVRSIIKHREENPDSRRRLYVLRLGKQIVDVLKSSTVIGN
jgi:hypothetical protein